MHTEIEKMQTKPFIQNHVDFNFEVKMQKLRVLAEMSANIAHEINNPLTIIVAKALQTKDILTEAQVTPKAIENLNQIISNACRITNIIKTLNLFARNREENDSKQSLFVEETINDTLPLVATKLRNKGVQIDLTRLDMTEQILTNPCDAVQVLTNLLMNSIDELTFNPAPVIEITSEVKNHKLLIKVSDNGPGVPEQLSEKIFESFFTTKTKQNGMGLGLSISRFLAKKNDGDLYVLSRDNGSCFCYEVPLANPKGISKDGI